PRFRSEQSAHVLRRGSRVTPSAPSARKVSLRLLEVSQLDRRPSGTKINKLAPRPIALSAPQESVEHLRGIPRARRTEISIADDELLHRGQLDRRFARETNPFAATRPWIRRISLKCARPPRLPFFGRYCTRLTRRRCKHNDCDAAVESAPPGQHRHAHCR